MREHHVQRIHPEHIVLDIGQDIGALIIYTRAELRGREIEVSLTGNETKKTHTEVLERRIARQPVFAAVFPGLAAGDYIIWGDAAKPIDSTTISGGKITEVDWRRSA